jgi:catechol 2,3-dioxygenase-like lactoylglutathione lyase family enzyme
MSLGAAGMHHMGLTVSDLDRSVAFYTRFGFDVTARIEEEGEEVEHGVGVAGAKLRVALLESENSRLELIQYLNPGDGPKPLPNNGTGAAHLCVEVADVDRAYEELRAAGIDFFSEPVTHESGIRWVYCRDPDGITTELLQVLE